MPKSETNPNIEIRIAGGNPGCGLLSDFGFRISDF